MYVPFGTEYSLLIKNKNSVRALVRVEVDGQDATETTSLIVPANGSIELDRFIKGGNLETGNRFKFIERTKKIEDGPRGGGAEDGLIRVEFEFEREAAPIKHYPVWEPRPIWYASPYPYLGSPVCMTNGGQGTLQAVAGLATGDALVSRAVAQNSTTLSKDAQLSNTVNAAYFNQVKADQSATTVTSTMTYSSNCADSSPTFEMFQAAAPKNDVGITVPGSVSEQKFERGSYFPTDGVKHVMVLKLLGEVEGKVVQKPVTVQAKPTCVTCGTVNKANSKFCRECGTALSIV